MKTNKQDLQEWKELCEWLSTKKGKAAYTDGIDVNQHLLSQEEIFVQMRKWMNENNVLPVFWSSGWGWRLRKDWKERLAKAEELI
ncbi:hypothetical protein NSS89_01345 [Caldifermentibacillus hisashii]|uniref:hypothetical protein n=1 Tax=Caldifermentibacillus hisashii TaxID=996558 RepID=UPI0031FCFE49